MAPPKSAPTPPGALVIFGAGGDLTKRLIIPALYNLMKSKLLSNMTHEFQTPVNSILALTRMLLERSDGDLSGEHISILPLSLPVRGLSMKGVSVGGWGSLPEAVRTTDIATAIELARTASHLFPVAAVYDLAQVTDAVAHAERPGRTGAVLLTSVRDHQRSESP